MSGVVGVVVGLLVGVAVGAALAGDNDSCCKRVSDAAVGKVADRWGDTAGNVFRLSGFHRLVPGLLDAVGY